jgi:hypothetical protein
MVQTLFSPLKLTVDLTVKVTGCDGIDNAWYQRQVLTICYEYIDKDINANVPKEMTADGISPMDAMVGQFLYTVCHEMGHAVFAALDVPLFGREEDAADAFATYLILKVGKSDARRLLKGAAYTYQKYLAGPRITAPVTAFADEHGAPLQRYYNMLCIALGAMPEDFSDIVDKGGLPASRARRCRNEFNELNYAFQQLIVPHLDPELAKVALAQDWLPKPEKPPMALK